MASTGGSAAPRRGTRRGSGTPSVFADLTNTDRRYEDLTWASHMARARDAGVVAVLFGDGVGESTRGRVLPPPDEGWFIGKVQSYLASPVRR
jgi:hypothetical protein